MYSPGSSSAWASSCSPRVGAVAELVGHVDADGADQQPYVTDHAGGLPAGELAGSSHVKKVGNSAVQHGQVEVQQPVEKAALRAAFFFFSGVIVSARR